jgi:hypothetical protein
MLPESNDETVMIAQDVPHMPPRSTLTSPLSPMPARLKMGIGQILMDKGDRHAALTNPRSTALDGAEPDIAGGEHAGVAGLQ